MTSTVLDDGMRWHILLQTDGARLRKLALSDTLSSTPAQPRGSASVPGNVQSFVIPAAAYFIAALIIGVMIGKLLL